MPDRQSQPGHVPPPECRACLVHLGWQSNSVTEETTWRMNRCGLLRRLDLPSSDDSLYSNPEDFTPEADSPPDGSTMHATSNAFAQLQVKPDSPPTPEPHMQVSTSFLELPAAKEPLGNEKDRSESYRCQCSLSYSDFTRHQHPAGSWRDSIGHANSQLIPQHSLHLLGRSRWAIEMQPEVLPISQGQLAAQVKGIYAGLVMVEAKCINIDTQKASHPEEKLSTEQWQDLVALHRTLLYEHHDFLMATQHPSANPALLGLATKYSMPARTWKYGIHAFLEVLRHRRPESQEYMLAFIYLAYQTVSLLLETVPSFTDTWIECLGDLARYRMAIEEERGIHTIWGGVAGRWYGMAADRHPVVGRLYHHSGILERPSMRKFYLFTRALTSVVPFLNAKESLGTLCSPVLNDGIRTGGQLAETALIRFHARAFTSRDQVELIARDGTSALTQLAGETDEKVASYGVSLAVTNIAALLGYGSPDNLIRQLFDSARNKPNLASSPSKQCGASSSFQLMDDRSLFDLETPSAPVVNFCYHSFNTIIRRTPGDKESLQWLLPFVHTMLVFFSSIETLQTQSSQAAPPNENKPNPLDILFSSSHDLDWHALSAFLNLTALTYPITAHIEDFADTNTFPTDGHPLLEDYMIRGLVWTQWYFRPKWFEERSEDDDGSRGVETEGNCKEKHRAARVLFLGMKLARQSGFLTYDREVGCFSATDDYIFVSRPTSKQSSHPSTDVSD